jgi:hypothetical protein
MQPLLCRSGYAQAMLDFSPEKNIGTGLVRFFLSRKRNEQPVKQVL